MALISHTGDATTNIFILYDFTLNLNLKWEKIILIPNPGWEIIAVCTGTIGWIGTIGEGKEAFPTGLEGRGETTCYYIVTGPVT